MASAFKRESDKGKKGTVYMGSWFDAEHGKWRSFRGYTDYDLTYTKAKRLENESALRREGFASPMREQSLRPLEEQLQEYLVTVVYKAKNARYRSQEEARVRRVLEAIRAKRLLDIDVAKVETVLLSMRSNRGFQQSSKLLAVSTRNEYVTSIKAFTGWATKRRKMEFDPLATLAHSPEEDDDRVHPRRALTVEEVTSLLDAALRRPQHELRIIRTGKQKGQMGAKVRPRVLEKAARTGIDRYMAYLLAVWTGFRRQELSKLEWRDVLLDQKLPVIQLRAHTTKAKRGDMIALHPQPAEELRAYRPANFNPHDRVLQQVPSINVMKRDLAFAGIDYGNVEDGYADLHAQRKTLNMMLAAQGISSRVRQALLRHTDPRLTEETYFDKLNFLAPQIKEVTSAANIPLNGRGHAAKPQTEGLQFAQLVHNGTVSTGLFESQPVTQSGRECSGSDVNPTSKTPQISRETGTKRHDPASSDTGSSLQRAKGVEPSTFTLATCVVL